MKCSFTYYFFVILAFWAWNEATYAQPLSGQIIVDPNNPARLLRKGEGPFFMAASDSPEGFLYRGQRNADGTRDGDQLQIIARIAKSGMNGLYMMAVRSNGGDGGSDENPFNDPANPASGLNPKILAQWEKWFSAMDRQGIVIYFVFYDDSAAPFGGAGREIPAGGTEAHFIKALVNRFEHHKNLIWCVAEEYSEANSRSNIRQIAQLIRNTDDHEHVIAVHQLDGTAFDFPDDPNIDQFAMQCNTAGSVAIHRKMVSAFEHAGGRYNLNMSESNKHYNPDHPYRRATRAYSWAAAMGGAEVMVYFKIRTNPFNVPDEILADQGRIVRFFSRTRLADLAPHDELLVGGGNVFVAANPGDEYVLYFENGSSANLDLRGFTSDFNCLWYNPRTGEKTKGNTIKGGATVWFEAPTAGKDWVLRLQKISKKNGIEIRESPAKTIASFTFHLLAQTLNIVL